MAQRKKAKPIKRRSILVRLTAAEHARLTRAAAPYKVATWAKVTLLAAADATLKKGGKR